MPEPASRGPAGGLIAEPGGAVAGSGSGSARIIPGLEGAPQLVLAFDFGRRRIGAACGDSVSRTARPLAAVANTVAGPRWEAVDSLLRDWQPALIVIGLPYNADGSESAMSTAARGFAADVAQRYALPVALVDERYSSLDAQARLKSQRQEGVRRHRVAKSDIDAAAACIILERWFTESRAPHADTTG